MQKKAIMALCRLGFGYISSALRYIFGIIHMGMGIACLTGNLFVLIIILATPRLRTRSYLIMGSLAMTDLLTAMITEPLITSQLLSEMVRNNCQLNNIRRSVAAYLTIASFTSCWFHGSSFKGFSIVFPAPWLAKVESSQKSNGMWLFRHFSRHFCSTVAETIGVTINPASFGAKKCSENHIWSCWDDSWSMEPTIQ